MKEARKKDQKELRKNIKSPTLRNTVELLKSTDGLTALYDAELNLYWASDTDFFSDFDMTEIKKELPITKETHFSVTVNGEKCVLTVTPAHKSVRTVADYSFVIRNNYQIYKMLRFSGNMDFLEKNIESCSEKIEKIKELNTKIKAASKDKKASSAAALSSLIAEQSRSIGEVSSELNNQRQYTVKEYDKSNANMTDFIGVLCNEIKEVYKGINRKISTQISERNFYYSIDIELYASAFLQILRFHTCTSPLKSTISITGDYHDGKGYGITIKTKANPDIGREEYDLYNSYREIAKKIILYDFNGYFSTDDSDKGNVTVAVIPTLRKNRGSLLTLRNAPYFKDDFKPCHTFMKERITQEIELLEIEKMEASKRKKMAEQGIL